MRTYCDFIVWTNEDMKMERIYPDEDFWLDCVSRVKALFENSILPELMGKWFSRPPAPASTVSISDDSLHSESASSETLYCYCQGPEEGDMIGCDHKECKYKWFHLSCLKLKSFPRSKVWYCPDCRKIKKK